MSKNTVKAMALPAASMPALTPILHEEDGELSLHFGFPTIQSSMRKADPDELILDYTRTMMGFLLFVTPVARIAMIGLGGGSLAKYCYRHLPRCDFTAVELSPAVIALREKFGVPGDDARFRVICADGADFVRDASLALDVLLVDGFDAGGQPPGLCTRAFYDDCRKALCGKGVLVVNLCADDADYDRHVGRISAAFAGRSVVVEAEDGDNKVVFASLDQGFPPTMSELTGRLARLEHVHRVDLDQTAQKILAGERSPDERGRRARRRRR